MKTTNKKLNRFGLPRIDLIEIETAKLWLKTGAIFITEKGEENTYFENEFGMKFFCKDL